MKTNQKIFLMMIAAIWACGIYAQDSNSIDEQMGLGNLSFSQYAELEGRIAMYKTIAEDSSQDKAFVKRTEKEILAMADKVFAKGAEISAINACALKPSMMVVPLTLACATQPGTIQLYFASEDDTMYKNFKKSYLDKKNFTSTDLSSQLFKARFTEGDFSGSIDRYAGKFVVSEFEKGFAKSQSKSAAKSKNGFFLSPKGYLMVPIKLTEGTFLQP